MGKEAPVGRLTDRLGFAAGVQDLLAEALDDYLIGPLFGEKPQQPGPWEMVTLHNRRVAAWNAMVLRSSAGAVGTLSAVRRADDERVPVA